MNSNWGLEIQDTWNKSLKDWMIWIAKKKYFIILKNIKFHNLNDSSFVFLLHKEIDNLTKNLLLNVHPNNAATHFILCYFSLIFPNY